MKKQISPIASLKEVKAFIELFVSTTEETFCGVHRVTIDNNYDMGYVYLTDQKYSYDNIEINDEEDNPMFVVDFDIAGCILGFEVFKASKRLPKWVLDKAENITYNND